MFWVGTHACIRPPKTRFFVLVLMEPYKVCSHARCVTHTRIAVDSVKLVAEKNLRSDLAFCCFPCLFAVVFKDSSILALVARSNIIWPIASHMCACTDAQTDISAASFLSWSHRLQFLIGNHDSQTDRSPNLSITLIY